MKIYIICLPNISVIVMIKIWYYVVKVVPLSLLVDLSKTG